MLVYHFKPICQQWLPNSPNFNTFSFKDFLVQGVPMLGHSWGSLNW